MYSIVVSCCVFFVNYGRMDGNLGGGCLVTFSLQESVNRARNYKFSWVGFLLKLMFREYEFFYY